MRLGLILIFKVLNRIIELYVVANNRFCNVDAILFSALHCSVYCILYIDAQRVNPLSLPNNSITLNAILIGTN